MALSISSTGFIDLYFEVLVAKLDQIISELSRLNNKIVNEKNEKVELWKETQSLGKNKN